MRFYIIVKADSPSLESARCSQDALLAWKSRKSAERALQDEFSHESRNHYCIEAIDLYMRNEKPTVSGVVA